MFGVLLVRTKCLWLELITLQEAVIVIWWNSVVLQYLYEIPQYQKIPKQSGGRTTKGYEITVYCILYDCIHGIGLLIKTPDLGGGGVK